MELLDSAKQEVLKNLLLVRLFEEKCLVVYEDEGIPELPHLSIGQEAVGVGAMQSLDKDDWVVPSLRTRAAILLRIPLKEVVAGMYGTVSGPSQGRTTQHHMGDTENRILGTTGMVGSHLNPATGAGLSSKILGSDTVSMVFFGDGATQRGEFHSAMNFAAVNDLPVVFVIENNGWTEETRAEDVTAVEDLADFGMHLPSETVDGQDVRAVIDAANTAVERAREGDGPSLIEAKTYRFRPHAEVIPERRPEDEIERWQERDPVDIYQNYLLDEDFINESELETLRADLQSKIDEAFEFVHDDPDPEEDVMYHVYSDVDVDADGTVVR